MLQKCLSLVFVITVFSQLLHAQMSKDTGFFVSIGEEAPAVEMMLTSGEKLTLEELRGKVVLLQFTASWCSVCRKEMPHLEKEIWQVHKDKDFILIGVDYDEPLEKVVAFKEKMKVSYPMALDPDADIFAQFAHKKSGVTRNVLIDKEGKIAFLTRLFDAKEFQALKDKVAELVDEEQ